ncbi:MAG: hypothetical protein IKI28_04680 [Bacteroidales bacterium]|nr:hypothetical protein [Bacteroidales bacterium]
MNYINDIVMKRLFFVVSAVLLSVGMLFVSACGTKSNDNLDVCEAFGQNKGGGGACQLYSSDNVCCDETTCTLTQNGKEYVCNKTNPGDCADVWLDQICPNASLKERQELAMILSARTAKLMNEVRLNSICCH